MTFGIARQQASRGGQRAMVANRGEDIAEFALARRGIADAIGREQRKLQRAGDFDGGAVAGFLLAMKMALQFDVDIVWSKNVRSGVRRSARASSIPP